MKTPIPSPLVFYRSSHLRADKRHKSQLNNDFLPAATFSDVSSWSRTSSGSTTTFSHSSPSLSSYGFSLSGHMCTLPATHFDSGLSFSTVPATCLFPPPPAIRVSEIFVHHETDLHFFFFFFFFFSFFFFFLFFPFIKQKSNPEYPPSPPPPDFDDFSNCYPRFDFVLPPQFPDWF